MRYYSSLVLSLALAFFLSPMVWAQTPQAQATPLARDVPIQAMAQRYIVSLFKDAADVQAEAEAVMRGRGGVIHQYFKSGFKGFAATIPAAELDAVRKNAKVLSVESFPMLRPAEAGSPAHQTSWGVDSKTLIGNGLRARSPSG
jgi:hypothetical protein